MEEQWVLKPLNLLDFNNAQTAHYSTDTDGLGWLIEPIRGFELPRFNWIDA
jgi:hypothetical protein